LLATESDAGEAAVVSVQVECRGRTCDFDVTVRHDDTGWSHYANRWEVLDESGEVIATRVLRHPHVNEQPFTRSLRGVEIPTSVERVRVRANDSHHGLGGAVFDVEIPRPRGEDADAPDSEQ